MADLVRKFPSGLGMTLPEDLGNPRTVRISPQLHELLDDVFRGELVEVTLCENLQFFIRHIATFKWDYIRHMTFHNPFRLRKRC